MSAADRPLRVLHYNHTSTVSGAEISLLTLAEELGRAHVVVVAAPEGDLLERARAAGLATQACRGTSGSLALHPRRTPVAVGGMVRAGVELACLARQRGADVIHANSPRSGLIAAVARRLGGPPVVVHVRDAPEAGRVGRLVFGVLDRSASSLVAISGFVADGLAREVALATPVLTVPNPVRSDRFFPDRAAGLAWRAAHGLAPDAPVLVVVGQITSWKRQDFAVEVLAAARARDERARLLVVGEVKFDSADTRLDNPAYLRRLRERAREPDVRGAVELLGERRDVADVLRAADVLLAPAEREPFGRAVAEAMVSGVPVVAPDGPGGPAELVRPGVDGALVAPDDLAGWAHAALALAGGPPPSPAARARAAELFSVERHAERMAEVFRSARRR